MRCGRNLLILAGSIAVAVPAIASDKLPPKAPAASEAATSPAPADAPDPSIAPFLIPDTPAPVATPAPSPAPAAPSPAVTSPPPVAAVQPLTPVDPDKVLSAYPFALFFDLDSADITPGAAEVLNNVVDAYHKVAAGHVSLSGYTDSSGAGGFSKALSERRVAAVRSFLIGKGVPADAISSEATGPSKPLIDSADGVQEPQNRRVEVTVTAGQVSTR